MRAVSLFLGLAAVVAGNSLPSEGVEARHSSGYWYENIEHNGISPFIPDGKDWTVFRNVKTHFGAKGDGVTDDWAAIQAAFDYANATDTRNASVWGTTGAPAVVYIPAGTYRLSKPLQSYIDTVVMGDPTNRPVLQASPDFSDPFLYLGWDPRLDPTINFYIALKNVVLDSTKVAPTHNITLLNWAVSQAVQLTNVLFNMPNGGVAHTGLSMPQGGSPLMINDVVFQGGSVGIRMNEQQYHFKGITFKNQDIGLKLDKLFEGTGQGLHFESCKVGIETTNNNTGFFALIDSTAKNVGILWNAAASPTAQGSIVLENVQVDSTTVTAGGKNVLRGSVKPGQSWIWGNVYESSGQRAQGKFFPATRPAALVDFTGAYHVATPPTFQEYSVNQVINVKSVRGLPVAGDGVTDDTKNLQKIINSAAGRSVLYFPHGTYLVSDTLVIPPGSRLHGEVWSEISATGSKFKNANHPVPMVQVGYPGQVGVAQFVDMLFTVADILPGCKLVEVNMAGLKAGDVGFFNSHFRLGGARGSKVQTNCDDPATCKAARVCAHLTALSSSYWENSWCWSADHDLDDDNGANPSTAGGFLVESIRSTWMLGIGSEHNSLYQINIHKAQNVFLGFQQSETPYWQGNNSGLLTPLPWTGSLLDSDPDFSWCAADDAQCRMAIFQYIHDSSNVNVYGGGYWVFFNGINRDGCSAECQQNAVIYTDNKKLFSYGVSTHNVRTMVLESTGGKDVAEVTDTANAGGWQSHGGVMAAYLGQSSY
ncbi:glycoside hydrolase family 55 protein [Trichoderma atroviride IMI 206040]|uniref:Glycoside hydrolase family 55 protein n=1 Tax=Hypocrea atroviridis (strain ATCC 20476 / IMI 206040) TaxID=452589 RepID=G9NG09_HYPAI|nr:glycoside hydrolase family 55 protein [Trichoderma atroviride IMI 206040]EHK50221.1 glycoside hydrolase family 55 protein [Trichoderma atroviride IMI 206040]